MLFSPINTSIKVEFAQAVGQVKTLIFDYTAEARAFYADFPAFRQLMFIETASQQLVAGDAARSAAFIEACRTKNNVFRAMKESHMDGSCHASYKGDRPQSCAVLLNEVFERQHLPHLLGAEVPDDVEKVFKLDHEIGHCVSPKGHHGEKNLRECVADAYAAIRHLQRFGGDTAYISSLVAVRALEVIFRPDDQGNHFTSPVVEKIIADSKRRDFSKMTPRQTVEAAEQYACQYAMAPAQLFSMAHDYKKFLGGYSALKKGNMQPLRDLGAHLYLSNNREQFKWGACAVLEILHGRVGSKEKRIEAKGNEWDVIRYALEQRLEDLGLSAPKAVTSKKPSLILLS